MSMCVRYKLLCMRAIYLKSCTSTKMSDIFTTTKEEASYSKVATL